MSWSPPLGLPQRRQISVSNLDASGNGSDNIYNNNSAVLMVIVQLSVITNPTGTSATTCQVSTPGGGYVDTSYFAGTGDVAGDEPHFIEPGDYITLTWSNGPPNGQGLGTYYYYEVPQ